MELHFKTVEKMIKEILSASIESTGFYYFHEYQNTYFRKKEDDSIYQYAIFGSVAGSRFSLSQQIVNRRVEDIIFEIGLPTIDLTNYDRKKNFLFIVNKNDIEEFNFIELKNKEAIEQFCIKVIDYIENEGEKFFTKYTHLPNILEEINTLMKEGKYWHQGKIKLGQGYYTGLIVSKLCNDPDYENKFEYVKSLYSVSENNLMAYLPYLEKLKQRLNTVEPLYNI